MSGGRPAWRLPPGDLGQRDLPIVTVPAMTPVVRLHTRGRDPHYFGRTGEGRFDDPNRAYGVCYLGFNDAAAFVETILRDQDLSGVAKADLEPRAFADGRFVRPARLVEFGGRGLRTTQAWSLALWGHSDQPDGIRYRSRFDDDQHCIALFNRAAAGLRFATSAPLLAVAHRLGPVLDRYDLALYD